MTERIEGEWIEIGHVAVRTKSILTAARIAAQVKQTRQVGTIDGVDYMDLGIFRARLALEEGNDDGRRNQAAAAAADPDGERSFRRPRKRSD